MPRRTYGASASLPWRWPQARPYSELHPMRVLFIPKNPPPRLEGDFSPEFKEFVARCLQKDGGRRPRARDLLDAPFIARAAGPPPARCDASPNEWARRRTRRPRRSLRTEAADAAHPRAALVGSATGPSRQGSTDPPEAAEKHARGRGRRVQNRAAAAAAAAAETEPNRDPEPGRNPRRARVRYPSAPAMRWCSHPRQPPPGDRRPRRRMRRRE